MPDITTNEDNFINFLKLVNNKNIHMGHIPMGNDIEIIEQLMSLGVSVEEYQIDKKDFENYVKISNYPSKYYGGKPSKGTNFVEKALEHYVSLKLLDINSNDIFIDIASDESPFPHIVRHLYGIKVYIQDLKYKEGIHGDHIGGSATTMPLPDNSVSKITLHCSFEHFEGDFDKYLIPEMVRILKKCGKLCIIPLYLSSIYAIQFDPIYTLNDNKNLKFDEEAQFFYHFNWNRHCRFYSPQKLKERVIDNIGKSVKIKVVHINNLNDIWSNLYCRFALIVEK